MGMAMAKVVGCVVVMCMVVVAQTPSCHAQPAITCDWVASNVVAQCINYLKTGGVVPAACCKSLRFLNRFSTTTSDRQTACRCLLSSLAATRGLHPALAAALPRECGVNIPYKIALSTDCSKID